MQVGTALQLLVLDDDEVVREVNALRAELPSGVREINFRKANPGLVNILQVAGGEEVPTGSGAGSG